MNCTTAREAFPELLDSRTAPTARLEARNHLAGCPDCQREFAALRRTLAALDTLATPAPSSRLRRNFYAMLEEEKHSAASALAAAARSPRARRARTLRWILTPLLGGALAVLGFVAGTRYAPAPDSTVETATVVADPAAHRRIAELEKKLDTMGQLVGYSLLQRQQSPANDRFRGVLTSASHASQNPDDQVINELIAALALDPSVNVRLRAIDALFPHADLEVVRAGVLASLPREQNPLVQVSMIDFLATAQDAESKPALEKLSLNEATDRSVRDAARRALAQF